jgi:hypothetical protein
MAQTGSRQRVLEETTLVDTDVHLTVQTGVVSAEDMRPYLDDERDFRRLKAQNAFPQSYGGDYGGGGGDRIDREKQMLTSPERVREHVCEQLHVDYPLLNTNPGVHKLPDGDLATRLMRAFNDYLVDHFLDPTDYFGLAAIVQQRPEQAAEEIERMAEHDQIVGIYMGSTGPRLPLGDPRFDPIYEAAEDNGLHVAYHGAAGDKFRYDFPKQHHGLRTFIEMHSLAHLWSQSLTVTSLVANGVPEKFPDLNFSFLESGLTWVPHVMWHLNREYERKGDEVEILTKPPEEYIRDQFYFASQPLGEPEQLGQIRQMIDVVGTESIMFASDFPHWDFDHPMELDKHLRNVFTEEEREQVFWKTPAEAFDLDI